MGAAKSREETPKEGNGMSRNGTISRCNNLLSQRTNCKYFLKSQIFQNLYIKIKYLLLIAAKEQAFQAPLLSHSFSV